MHVLEQIADQAIVDDVLRQLREQAQQDCQQLTFPNRKHESWKYTDLDGLKNQAFSYPMNRQAVSEAKVANFLLPDSYRLVIVDGYYRDELSYLPSSISVQPLSAYLASPADLSWIKSIWHGSRNSIFQAMNAGFSQEGMVVRLSSGEQLDRPVQLLVINQQQDGFNPLKLMLNLSAGARMTWLEHYVSQGETCHFNHIASTINLAPEAKLDWVRLQQEGRQAFHLATTECMLAESAQLHARFLSCGGRLARHEITCHLKKASELTSQAVFWAQDRQHIEERITVLHEESEARSDMHYRGIADGRSRAVFNGSIQVLQQAQKTQANLTNKNLLLSNQAEIDTKPELVIDADDVQCSHGATIGELDKEALFALRSRCLSEQDARQILIRAFAQAIRLDTASPAIRIMWEDLLMLAVKGGDDE